eukprot:TRINITY_DN1183_c0_g1_i2.p1 TRINITY_DN1183_c0_g1~~TRINITY_DN1183_c0_g1_i2.p1  ORF type:complete len:462 (+),score=104.78 TRINITY_DN1183_c0_g1_i2:647-2032(+)
MIMKMMMVMMMILKEEEEEEEVVDQEEEEEEEELDVPDSQRFWCKEQPFVVALSLIASGCPRSYEIAHSSPLFEDVFRSIILNPSQFSLLIGARAVRTVSRICMEEASFTVLDNIVPSYPKAPVCYLDSSQTGMATMNRRGRPRAEIMGTDANGDPSINVNMDVDMDVDVDTDTDTEMVIHEAPIRPCSFSRFPRTFHRRSEWKRLYIARDLIQCHGQHGVFWGEEPENMAQRVFVWCTETLVTQKSRPEHWRLANELLNLIGRHFRQVDDEVAMKSHIYECTLESMRWIGNRVADLRILMGRLDGHPLKRRIKWLLAWKILHVLANIDRDPPFAILIVDHDGDDGSDGRVWEEARKLQSELVALLNVVSLNDGLSLTVFADAILCLSEMTIDSPHFELDEIERFRHLIKSQIKRLSPKKRTFANCRMESAIRRIGDCIQNARASSQDRCWYSSKGRELVV